VRFVDGTENGLGPFWSPDSQFIGFVAGRKLWKTPVRGGSPSLICEVPGSERLTAAVWGPEDQIFIAAWRGDLYEVSAQGGDPRMILDLDLEQDIDIHYLTLLPDGKTLLFTPHSTSGTFPIEALVDGERRVVMKIEGQQLNIPILDRSGNLLYERRGTNEGIWAVPFSVSQVGVVGEPFLVAPESGLHSVSQDGTLTYSAMAGALSQLAWIDRQNQAQEVLGEPRVGLVDPALSPDGSKVLAILEESGREEVWVFDLQREIWSRLTFEDAEEVDAPSWTTDGDRVVYESGDMDKSRILIVSADGSGKPEVLVESGDNPTLTPDGSTLLFEKIEEESRELWSQPLDGSQEASRLVDSPFKLRRALVHPSGRFMAFGSNESGDWEVYLTQYPSMRGKWQLSTDGGIGMVWSRDGSRFYFHDSQTLFEIDIEVEPALQLGSARPVFSEVGVGTVLSPDASIDISPDGERLLVVQSPDFRDGAVGVVVVQNWLGQFDKP
jgi:Tol biopolymer transport system component